MAKIKKLIYNLNANMLLFAAGVVAGTVAINFFWSFNKSTSSDILKEYFGETVIKSSFGSLFTGIFIRRAVLIILLIIIFEIINSIWSVYITVNLLGILVGVVMTVLSINMGVKSIGSFLLMCFPHIIFYAAAVYILIRKKFSGYYTKKISTSDNSYTAGISGGKTYIIAAVLFLLGIVFETVNAMYILPFVISGI